MEKSGVVGIPAWLDVFVGRRPIPDGEKESLVGIRIIGSVEILLGLAIMVAIIAAVVESNRAPDPILLVPLAYSAALLIPGTGLFRLRRYALHFQGVHAVIIAYFGFLSVLALTWGWIDPGTIDSRQLVFQLTQGPKPPPPWVALLFYWGAAVLFAAAFHAYLYRRRQWFKPGL